MGVVVFMARLIYEFYSLVPLCVAIRAWPGNMSQWEIGGKKARDDKHNEIRWKNREENMASKRRRKERLMGRNS